MTDKDGAGDADTFTVTVANVAPTVAFTAGPARSTRAPAEHIYSYTITDPGTDTVSSVATSCGANGGQVGRLRLQQRHGRAASTAPSPTARPARPSRSRRTTPTGGQHRHPPVTVINVAPTVTLTGADRSTRARPTPTPSPSPTRVWTRFTLDAGYPTCGHNGSSSPGSLTVTAAGGSFQCTFPDGPASTSVAVKVTDSDGASDTDSRRRRGRDRQRHPDRHRARRPGRQRGRLDDVQPRLVHRPGPGQPVGGQRRLG